MYEEFTVGFEQFYFTFKRNMLRKPMKKSTVEINRTFVLNSLISGDKPQSRRRLSRGTH